MKTNARTLDDAPARLAWSMPLLRWAVFAVASLSWDIALAQELSPQPSGPAGVVLSAGETTVPRPPAKVGCYHYGPSGWATTNCASETYIRTHYPHLASEQYAISTATFVPTTNGGETSTWIPLSFGSVEIRVISVGSVVDSLAGVNAFSIQNNTNVFSNDNWQTSDWVQFGDQSAPGMNDNLCVWNNTINPTKSYSTTCVNPPNMRGGGGLVAGDDAKIWGFAYEHTLTVTAFLPWTGSGNSAWWAAVAPDMYDLAGNWNEVSGSILGFGKGSQLQFTGSHLKIGVSASTCEGDVSSSVNLQQVCSNVQNFSSVASVNLFGNTGESNNLPLPSVAPSIAWPNMYLAQLDYEVMSPAPSCVGADCEGIACHVFGDGYSNMVGPSDAIFINGKDQACIPSGTAQGTCRKWFGRCVTTKTAVGVDFQIFDDGYANLVGPSDAIFINGKDQACIPSGTAQGICRKWFGRGTVYGGRGSACTIFNDGYANQSSLSDAVFIDRTKQSCIPGVGFPSCEKWWGRCTTTN